MTPQEIEELTKVLEKTILERYEKSLERFGNLKSLYQRSESENDNLSGRIKQLTTSNKKLTNKLARALEGLQNYQKHILYLSNVIERAREISPEVCARMKEIQNEEFARIKTNE